MKWIEKCLDFTHLSSGRFQEWMFKKSNIHFMLYMKRNWHSLEKSADKKEEYQFKKSGGPETEAGDHQQPREPERTPVFSTAAPSSVLRSTQSNGVSTLRRVCGVPGPELAGGHNLLKKTVSKALSWKKYSLTPNPKCRLFLKNDQ
jgi:hypothetical protein